MKTGLMLGLAGGFALVLAGCTPREQTGRGFALPAGSAERGQAAFVELKCHECHTIDGVELPAPAMKADRIVVLGGEVGRLRSFGDLVTAIIHPSERISELMKDPPAGRQPPSPMPVVNDRMTVTQMVDLATFLQPRYRAMPPPVQHVY